MPNAFTAAELEARHDPWPDPIPLLGTQDHLQPYPVDALPDVIRDAVQEVQGFIQAPLPLVACSALSAVSLASQAHVDVQRAEGLTGPTGLFFLVVAPSGERKTTVDTQFLDPVRQWEKRQADAAAPELAEYRANLDIWKARREGLTDQIRAAAKKNQSAAVAEDKPSELELQKPEPPRIPTLLRVDSTPEDLAWKLMHDWPSAGIISSEAGIVFGAHAMGRDSQMRNIGLLNTLWDGKELPIGRRTTDSFTVRGARLTMALQVQQEALYSFTEHSNGLARGMGFFARFLVAWPTSTQGSRLFTDPPAGMPALGRFHQRLANVLDLPLELQDGSLAPRLLQLSPAAKAVFVLFHNDVERELGAGGDLGEVRDVASKAADNAARLAALFHVFTGDTRDAIQPDLIEAASVIVAHHLTEAVRFFDGLAVSPQMIDAIKLDAWLIARCQKESTAAIPRQKARQFGPNRVRHKKVLDSAIEVLVDAGRVRIRQDGRRMLLDVNPGLLGGQA